MARRYIRRWYLSQLFENKWTAVKFFSAYVVCYVIANSIARSITAYLRENPVQLRKIPAYFTAVASAAQAGWIASRCTTGCVIDDENEEIRPCRVHAESIYKLQARNQTAWGAVHPEETTDPENENEDLGLSEFQRQWAESHKAQFDSIIDDVFGQK